MSNGATPTQFAGYRLVFSKKALKFLQKLPSDQRRVFVGKLDVLRENSQQLDIKKLHGYVDLFRIRVGDYRIIFEADPSIQTVYVHIIEHRRHVYQMLARQRPIAH